MVSADDAVLYFGYSISLMWLISFVVAAALFAAEPEAPCDTDQCVGVPQASPNADKINDVVRTVNRALSPFKGETEFDIYLRCQYPDQIKRVGGPPTTHDAIKRFNDQKSVFQSVAKHFEIPWQALACMSMRESDFDPNAINGSFVGLGQLSQQTINEIVEKLGEQSSERKGRDARLGVEDALVDMETYRKESLELVRQKINEKEIASRGMSPQAQSAGVNTDPCTPRSNRSRARNDILLADLVALRSLESRLMSKNGLEFVRSSDVASCWLKPVIAPRSDLRPIETLQSAHLNHEVELRNHYIGTSMRQKLAAYQRSSGNKQLRDIDTRRPNDPKMIPSRNAESNLVQSALHLTMLVEMVRTNPKHVTSTAKRLSAEDEFLFAMLLHKTGPGGIDKYLHLGINIEGIIDKMRRGADRNYLVAIRNCARRGNFDPVKDNPTEYQCRLSLQ
jgi:hypothetical protein